MLRSFALSWTLKLFTLNKKAESLSRKRNLRCCGSKLGVWGKRQNQRWRRHKTVNKRMIQPWFEIRSNFVETQPITSTAASEYFVFVWKILKFCLIHFQSSKPEVDLRHWQCQTVVMFEFFAQTLLGVWRLLQAYLSFSGWKFFIFLFLEKNLFGTRMALLC